MISRDEFERLLQDGERLLQMSKQEAEQLFGEKAARMVGYDQRNPHHCYNLWEHTIHAITACGREADILLKAAAFFHDIGKPEVAFEKEGRLVYYGHAQRSAQIARNILYHLGYDENEIKEICFYIGHHDDFISWRMLGEPIDSKNKFLKQITPQNVQKYIQKLMDEDEANPKHEQCKSLLDLCYADILSQSDEVWQNGVLIDTKQHKLAKIETIKAML